MPAPHDGRCGAASVASASSATVRPLPPHGSFNETPVVSTSVYTRFWTFLFDHWHATQPKAIDSAKPTRRRSRARLSASSEMRQHVDMLHEIEAHPHSASQHGVRAMQTTCANCHQRFFRERGADAVDVSGGSFKTKSKTEYCSLDCRSSAQYRATVQHSIDQVDAFGSTMADSTDITTSRL